MNKTSLMVLIGILLIVPFTMANYNYYIYEDFDDALDSTWNAFNAGTVIGGEFRCITGSTGGLWLNDPLADFAWGHDYNITVAKGCELGGGYCTYSTRGFQFHPNITINQDGDGNNRGHYPNSGNSDKEIIEYWNGNLVTHIVDSGSLDPVPNEWKYLSYIVTSKEDGTRNVKVYKDFSTLVWDVNTTYAFNETERGYHSAFWRCYGVSNHQLSLDNLTITITESPFLNPEEPVVDTSFGSRRRRSKASRTALIEAPVELEPVKEPSTDGLSDGQKLVIVALGGVVAYSIFTAKPKPRRIRRRK